MGGFSASGATVVLMVGLIVSLGVLLPVLGSGISETGDAFENQQARTLETENADFIIANYTYVNGTPNSLTLNITNTGTESLQIDEFDYQINGGYTVPNSTYVNETPNVNRSIVAPGETLIAEFSLSYNVSRVHVTCQTGESELLTNP